MPVIAHAGHWALGLIEAFPLIAVAAFAAWSNLRGAHLGLTEDHAETRATHQG